MGVAAIGTAAVLVLSGALDAPKSVHLDATPTIPVTQSSPVHTDNQALRTYLSAFDDWNACVAREPASATSVDPSTTCGAPPAQPDDPLLNSYLAQVLDWNKCAAPRLRRGGLEQAEIACGQQPTRPSGG